MPRGSAGGSPIATREEDQCPVVIATTGRRCKNRRQTGLAVCYQHNPENAGTMSAHARAIAKLPQPAKWTMARILDDEDDVLRATKRSAMRAIIDVYARKLSPAQGQAIAALLGKLIDATTRGDFEARLRAAESELRDMREGTRADVLIEGDWEDDGGAP